MSSNTLVLRLPVRADVHDDVRDASRAPVERREARRDERPEHRAALARVAEDVSPSVRGGFRLFAW